MHYFTFSHWAPQRQNQSEEHREKQNTGIFHCKDVRTSAKICVFMLDLVAQVKKLTEEMTFDLINLSKS